MNAESDVGLGLWFWSGSVDHYVCLESKGGGMHEQNCSFSLEISS